MNNSGYDDDGLNIFDVNPIEEAINSNENTVKTFGNQTIGGDKVFTGTVTLENEIIHNSTSFSTEDGIIEQLKGNTGDLLDYGNYAVYNDGVSTKYKGIINKKQTDKFYVFHNQTNQPISSLNLGTQNLGSLVVREPVEDDEVATKKYIDSHTGGNYLPLSGGTMTGNINIGNNKITHLKSLDFDNTGIYNEITFNQANKLSFTCVDNNGGLVSEYIHLNDTGFNKLIELMQDINLHGNINVLNNKRITGLQSPTSNSEPATKEYVDNHTGGNYLPLSGGTMTGDINMDTHDIINASKVSLKPTTAGGATFFDFIDGDNGRGKLFISGIGRMEISTANQEFTRFQLFQKLQMDDKIYFSSPHKIEGLADGTVAGDAVNKGQLDTKLNLSGGTMSGNIDLGGNDLINCDVVRPSGGSSLQLLSQSQVGGIRIFDTLVDVFSDIRMNGNNISFLGEPTLSHQATTKQYVDNAVNGGGEVHLPKYHTVFFNPSPDAGETYKTYTNDGFFGQAVFECQSPVMSTTSGYVLWNINIPPLFFTDALVDFIIRIKEGATYVEDIQAGATYNGTVGSGYRTVPIVSKGCHEIQTTDPTVILGVEVWCKPRTAISGTAKLDLTAGNDLFKMYRVADFELININP